MVLNRVHNLLSFKRLLFLVSGLAISVQLAIITYNHYSGYVVMGSISEFLQHMFFGSLLSIIAGFLIAYPDLFIIRYLNKVVPWNKNIIKRILIQFSLTIAFAGVVAVLITLLSNFLSDYSDNLLHVIVSNILIFSVVNLIIMSVMEAWILFIDNHKTRQIADHLEAELSQIKYEVLKSQINPHFMFNSLNVLSGLINTDLKKAQQFIDEFSHIYRYVLESIEQPVATLEKELDFAQSYLFLQQIRYGKNLTYSVCIPSDKLGMLLPPLTMQVVLENTTKHNIVNDKKPLHIDIEIDTNNLVIKNAIQPKVSKSRSNGLGLKNLQKRYAMISSQEPVFMVEAHYFVAKLPLIKTENDESPDN